MLKDIDGLYAEDTRHTGKLLEHLGVSLQLRSLHEHNEQDRVQELLERLHSGENLGLVSDAGTPLISDPGYRIVSACHRDGIRVSPVAGPSSVVAALSVSGLPTDRFSFYGFLPSKAGARRALLGDIALHEMTTVCFESKHRIVTTLSDICDVMGDERLICVARELTKTFESVLYGNALVLYQRVLNNPNEQKGEFVIVIAGARPQSGKELSADVTALLLDLSEEIPPRKAAAIVARHTGVNKKRLYEWLVVHGNSQ